MQCAEVTRDEAAQVVSLVHIVTMLYKYYNFIVRYFLFVTPQ